MDTILVFLRDFITLDMDWFRQNMVTRVIHLLVIPPTLAILMCLVVLPAFFWGGVFIITKGYRYILLNDNGDGDEEEEDEK